MREGEEKGITRMRWRRWKEREGKGSGIRELGMGDVEAREREKEMRLMDGEANI